MKKRIVVGLVVVLVAIMVLSTSGMISAKQVRTDFTGLEYDCRILSDETKEWGDPAGMWHMRHVLHSNPNISETPEFNGVHHTVADADINFATGVATIRGTSHLVPYGIDGAWIGHWTFLYNNNHNYGWGVMRGTGALSGKIAFVDVYDVYEGEPGFEPPVNICDDIGGDPDLDGQYEAPVRTVGTMLEIGKPFEQTAESIK